MDRLIQQAQQCVQAGDRTAVDVGLERLFDRINHDMLMDRLAKRIADKAVLRLIRRCLQAGILAHGVCSERAEGTPQGGPLSLMPTVMRELDEWLRHRLRAVRLKHWKRGTMADRDLRKPGARVDETKRVANHGRSIWHTSRLGMNRLLPVAQVDRLGVPGFS